jgi:hypothetical protein
MCHLLPLRAALSAALLLCASICRGPLAQRAREGSRREAEKQRGDRRGCRRGDWSRGWMGFRGCEDQGNLTIVAGKNPLSLRAALSAALLLCARPCRGPLARRAREGSRREAEKQRGDRRGCRTEDWSRGWLGFRGCEDQGNLTIVAGTNPLPLRAALSAALLLCARPCRGPLAPRAREGSRREAEKQRGDRMGCRTGGLVARLDGIQGL